MPKVVDAPAEPSRFGIAINLCDLTDKVDQLVRQLLLRGKVELSKDRVIRVGENFDDSAVRFTCDALTAACICDTIRAHDHRVGDYPTRVYVQKAVAWVKVAGHEHLSIVVGERVVLNPKVFGDEVVTVRESRPLPARALTWG